MKRTIINGENLLRLLAASHVINFIIYMIFYYDVRVWGPMDISYSYGYYSTLTIICVIFYLLCLLAEYIVKHWSDDDIFRKKLKS